MTAANSFCADFKACSVPEYVIFRSDSRLSASESFSVPAKLKTQIEKLAVNDIELLKLINSVQIENYGEIGQSEVSYSSLEALF